MNGRTQDAKMSMKPKVVATALSALGLLGIATFEGYSEDAYVPVKGDVPTIGFGSTEGVQLGDKTTPAEALQRLAKDVEGAENAVRRCVSVPLSQGEFDAFTSFSFNVGAGAFCSSTLVKKLNTGDHVGACRELRRWVYVGKTKTQGLVNRREAEFERCMEGL